MKPHETIELIILTVCRHYRADWRKAMSKLAGVKTPERKARRVIAHLVYIFLDEVYAMELMGICSASIKDYTNYFNSNQKELMPLQTYILKSMNAKKQFEQNT